MKLLLSKDKRYFLVDDIDVDTAEALREELSYIVPYIHVLKKKYPWKYKNWDGKTNFIDKDMRIPRGLWDIVYKFCKKHNIKLDIYGASYIIDQQFNYDEFKAFCLSLFEDHPVYTPYDYQIEAAAKILKYKFNQSEIATSAGKTMISFLIFMWLKSKGFKKQLIIVPRLTLITQFIDDYNEFANGTHDFTYQEIKGNTDKLKQDVDFVVGTYQSLVKLPAPWYSEIDSLFVDEAHTATSKSVKDIIIKNLDVRISYGMSGTIDQKNKENILNTQAFLGPIIQHIQPVFLMDNGFITNTKIKIHRMDYLPYEHKKMLQEVRVENRDAASKALTLEKDIVRNNNERFKYVVDRVLESQGNSLVLFTDIKNGYGKRIYEYLKNVSDKRVYYIDGGTKESVRDYFKKVMEQGEKEVITVTVGNNDIVLNPWDDILLSNGTTIKAEELNEGDDIDDNFLLKYV
jgi:superfamily II DNA or RNA helicase